MELIVYLACAILIAPYALMCIASFKIFRELQSAVKGTKDHLDFPITAPIFVQKVISK